MSAPTRRPRRTSPGRLLARRLAEHGTLVVAHRGTAVGSIAENTRAAALAALASGADVVEIDVATSADGEFFAFHVGAERRLLGIDENLTGLAAREIDALRYVHVDRPGRPVRVERLLDLLAALRPAALGVSEESAPLVNVDRSWNTWSTLLPALDGLDMAEQLLLKSPVALAEPLDVLRRHGTAYPYLPICTSVEQVREVVEDPDLEVVGVELLADGVDHPLADPGLISELHARGLCVMVNAEVLTAGTPLFAGHDDEAALRDGPEAGWGPLFDLGVDLVQTDWPWLLHAYRGTRSGLGAAGASVVDQEVRP